MSRIPLFYEYDDGPEMFGKAMIMFTMCFTPIIFGVAFVLLCYAEYNESMMPFALLFIIPSLLMFIVGKRKLEDMHSARVNGTGTPDEMFGKAMVTVTICEVPAIILLAVLILILMM